jgi:hypothetical protein
MLNCMCESHQDDGTMTIILYLKYVILCNRLFILFYGKRYLYDVLLTDMKALDLHIYLRTVQCITGFRLFLCFCLYLPFASWPVIWSLEIFKPPILLIGVWNPFDTYWMLYQSNLFSPSFSSLVSLALAEFKYQNK